MSLYNRWVNRRIYSHTGTLYSGENEQPFLKNLDHLAAGQWEGSFVKPASIRMPGRASTRRQLLALCALTGQANTEANDGWLQACPLGAHSPDTWLLGQGVVLPTGGPQVKKPPGIVPCRYPGRHCSFSPTGQLI